MAAHLLPQLPLSMRAGVVTLPQPPALPCLLPPRGGLALDVVVTEGPGTPGNIRGTPGILGEEVMPDLLESTTLSPRPAEAQWETVSACPDGLLGPSPPHLLLLQSLPPPVVITMAVLAKSLAGWRSRLEDRGLAGRAG